MELKNKILKKIHNMLNGLEGLCIDEYVECCNELLRVDMLERKITDGCNMQTIANALNKLKQETGFGVKDDEDKQQESERKETAKLSTRHVEGSIPPIA